MPDVTSKDISEESSLAKLERKIPSILDKKNDTKSKLEEHMLSNNKEATPSIKKMVEQHESNNVVEAGNPIDALTLEQFNKVLIQLNELSSFHRQVYGEEVESIKPSTAVSFSAIFYTTNLRKTDPESIALLEKLEKYGFITQDGEDIKVTGKLYKNQEKKHVESIKFDIDSFKNSELNFEICKLVINTENTMVASGIQKHAVVTIPLNDNKKIIIGFLTSDKTDILLLDNNMKKVLSITQPFDQTSEKQQMYTILKEPLIVSDNNIEELPPNCKPTAIAYVKNSEVFYILKNSVENYLLEKIEKNNNYISVYNGDGFTKEELYTILKNEEEIMEQTLKEHIKKYKEMQFKNKNKIEAWLKNIKAVSSKKYIELLEDAIKREN